MFGNGISFSGLASGLDTKAIIEQLVALERLPIKQIEAQKANDQAKLDLLGTLGGLVQTLQEKAEALRSSSEFFSYGVGMSREGIATITATGEAQAGSHSLEVLRTASIDRWAFDGVADIAADLATADGQGISFTVNGTAYDVTMTAADSDLNHIASAINEVAGSVVSASVVNAGTAATPSYQLVIASKASGEESRVSGITNSIAGLTIDTTGPNPNGDAQSENNITVGKNAIALVDGLQVERTDNDFSDVIVGVSIDVLSANPGQQMTFTVEPDREAIKGRVTELVDSYNAVIDFVNEQSKYSPEAGTGGDLFGDPILRRVRNEIQAALFNVGSDVIQGDTEGYATLSLVGIHQDSDGHVSIDTAALDAKMSQNLALFSDLFVDTDGFERVDDEPNTPGYFQDATEDSGLADVLWRVIDRITSSQEGAIVDQTGKRMALDGIFTGRENMLKENLGRYDDQIESKERRLDLFEEGLVKRFAALETLMGALNSQGTALQNALAGISNL